MFVLVDLELIDESAWGTPPVSSYSDPKCDYSQASGIFIVFGIILIRLMSHRKASKDTWLLLNLAKVGLRR
jgi:hypothetical protein